jgi:hypothetical protein
MFLDGHRRLRLIVLDHNRGIAAFLDHGLRVGSKTAYGARGQRKRENIEFYGRLLLREPR